MTRTYTKTKRAEREAETRDRIVEAALGLHGEIGPNRTTISMIADRAGVQRHTVYSHFPDERALLLGCSGRHAERAPLPSPELWAAANDPAARLRMGLAALYGWFAQNEQMTTGVLRDAEQNEVLAEISGMRFGEPLAAIFGSLAEGLSKAGAAALTLAMSFYTWRTLVRDSGLGADAAVELMVRTILAAGVDN